MIMVVIIIIMIIIIIIMIYIIINVVYYYPVDATLESQCSSEQLAYMLRHESDEVTACVLCAFGCHVIFSWS